MSDLTLVCVQCDQPFIYSAAAQARAERHGFDPPRRCPECRQHKVRMEGEEAHWDERRHVRRNRHKDE